MANTKQTQLQQLPPLMLPMLLVLLLLPIMAFNSAKALPSIQVCGPGLTDTLFLVCKGHFGTFQNHKRASLDLFDYVEHQNDEQNDVDDSDDISLLWQQPAGKSSSHSSMLSTRRLVRGVVDECCRKACTLPEMKQYCSN